MEYLPFIYFTIVTAVLLYYHKRMDICVYISGLYALTSLCASMIAHDPYVLGESGILFDSTDIELNFMPTFAYCALLTLSLLPFTMIYKRSLKKITVASPLTLYVISWILIGVSLLNLYLVADSTLDILSGDLEAVRQAHYSGVESPAQIKAESMPSILGYFYYFNKSTLLSLPIFFYYLCCEHRAWWFKTLLFFSSLSVPLAGVQAADRTEIILFSMMLVYCVIFYWGLMSRTLKRKMKLAAIPFISLGLLYIGSITLARFENRSESASGSVLAYAGQGYINYCFFWENAKSDYPTLERELPAYYHFVKHIDSNPERRAERSGQQGFYISVFPTYLGELLLDLTIPGMIVWTVFFFLAGMLIIKKREREEFDISEVLIIYLMAVVMIFGVFYYRYFTFMYSILLIMVVWLYIISRSKIDVK